MTSGLKESNLVASSITPHNSIRVVGSYPLGTLRVVNPDPPSLEAGNMYNGDTEDFEQPPPLDPTSEEQSPEDNNISTKDTNGRRLSTQLDAVCQHGVGSGDIILILDLPNMFTIGYDSVAITTKEFHGISDIPDGPHFIWVAPSDEISPRSGCWIFTSGANRIHVLQWDKFNEILCEPGRSEARFQAEAIVTTYPKLVSYKNPLHGDDDSARSASSLVEEQLRVWPQLSGAITEEVVRHILAPSEEGIFFVNTTDYVKGCHVTKEEQELLKKSANPFLGSKELAFTFSQVSRTFSTDLVGRDRTLEATDATSYIVALLDAQASDLRMENFGGEFQFAYVTGMHLGSDACIQQWWHMLVKLILKAFLLPECQPKLASALLRAVAAQLFYTIERLEIPLQEYAGENGARDLRLGLTVYKRRLDELLHDILKTSATPEHIEVGNAFARVEAVVTRKLDWDIGGNYLRKGRVVMEDGEAIELELADLEGEDERGDYAPTLVSLDDSGRQSDLISWSS